MLGHGRTSEMSCLVREASNESTESMILFIGNVQSRQTHKTRSRHGLGKGGWGSDGYRVMKTFQNWIEVMVTSHCE